MDLPEPGHYEVALEATDNNGLVGYDTMSLRARVEGSLPPRILSVPNRFAAVGEPDRYALQASPQVQGTRPLIWSLGKVIDGVSVGTVAGMRIDGATGALTWTPSAEQVGVHDVTLVAQNEAGLDLQDFRINVAIGEGGEGGGGSGGCSVERASTRHAFWSLFLLATVLVGLFWRRSAHT